GDDRGVVSADYGHRAGYRSAAQQAVADREAQRSRRVIAVVGRVFARRCEANILEHGLIIGKTVGAGEGQRLVTAAVGGLADRDVRAGESAGGAVRRSVKRIQTVAAARKTAADRDGG